MQQGMVNSRRGTGSATAGQNPLQLSPSPTTGYQGQIESCYRYHPRAAVYYHPLARHTSSRKEDPNIVRNSLKAYEVVEPGQDPLPPPSATDGPYRAVDPYSHPKNGRLYVVEGHVLPETINFLGSRLGVRPELFIGHLGLSNDEDGRPRYYEWPALPSRRTQIVHIQMVTIAGAPPGARRNMDIVKARQDAAKSCNEYNRKFDTPDLYLGATRFRTVNLHDQNTFTVEQMISFALIRDDKGWQGVFLLDKGFDNGERLKNETEIPWAKYMQHEVHPRMVPVIPYGSYGIAQAHKGRIASVASGPAAILSPYHPINHLGLASDEDITMLQHSPLYILSQVLLESALSWNQVLNLVERDVETCQSADDDESQGSLHQLRFDIGYIDHMREFLDRNYDVLRNHQCSDWPKCPNPLLQRKVEDLQKVLLSDYQYLHRRCEAVAKRAERASNTIIRDIQHRESSRSITQANKVSSLTILAYLFLPWSLAASVFGMNVTQMVNGALVSVWQFVLTAMCLLLVALFAAYRVEILQWSFTLPDKMHAMTQGKKLPGP